MLWLNDALLNIWTGLLVLTVGALAWYGAAALSKKILARLALDRWKDQRLQRAVAFLIHRGRPILLGLLFAAIFLLLAAAVGAETREALGARGGA